MDECSPRRPRKGIAAAGLLLVEEAGGRLLGPTPDAVAKCGQTSSNQDVLLDVVSIIFIAVIEYDEDYAACP